MNDRHACEDLRTIKDSLRKNRRRAADIRPTSGAGVYALYLSRPHALGGIEADTSGPLYIGMTEDSLEARNHFGHRDSSFSSPRRSLGAILKEELGLNAIPRGSGKSAKDITCYRFAGDGEKSLTNWMVRHLEYSFVVLEHGIQDIERTLIECLQPPLNLDKWKNGQKAAIMRLRKVCADEARRAAPQQEER
jgi:hypothetical protein